MNRRSLIAVALLGMASALASAGATAGQKDPIEKAGERLLKGDLKGAAREVVKPTETATDKQEEKHKQDAIRENMAKCGRPTFCN